MTRMNADKIPASRPFDPDKHVLRIADYAVLLQNHGLNGLRGFASESRITPNQEINGMNAFWHSPGMNAI